jgi:hypothetical protein
MSKEIHEIVVGLKAARQSAFGQIERINRAIEILTPRPAIRPPLASADQYKTAFLEVITNSPQTAGEIRRKSGFMSESQTYKYLKELTDEGKIERSDINGIRHYTTPREELRLVAGHGVTSRKRRRAS